MTKRDNHYECAFEEFLRSRGVPYVAVDETRRALLADQSLKSLDFIVSPPGVSRLLVDVKGRRFPSGTQKQYWKNWSTRDDLVSLAQWEELFGAEFTALLVFAYCIVGDRAPLPREQLFEHRDHVYAFVAVSHEQYASHSRLISPKWDTVAMPLEGFRGIAQPFEDFLAVEEAA